MGHLHDGSGNNAKSYGSPGPRSPASRTVSDPMGVGSTWSTASTTSVSWSASTPTPPATPTAWSGRRSVMAAGCRRRPRQPRRRRQATPTTSAHADHVDFGEADYLGPGSRFERVPPGGPWEEEVPAQLSGGGAAGAWTRPPRRRSVVPTRTAGPLPRAGPAAGLPGRGTAAAQEQGAGDGQRDDGHDLDDQNHVGQAGRERQVEAEDADRAGQDEARRSSRAQGQAAATARMCRVTSTASPMTRAEQAWTRNSGPSVGTLPVGDVHRCRWIAPEAISSPGVDHGRRQMAGARLSRLLLARQ